jgi:hypothetical protein
MQQQRDRLDGLAHTHLVREDPAVHGPRLVRHHPSQTFLLEPQQRPGELTRRVEARYGLGIVALAEGRVVRVDGVELHRVFARQLIQRRLPVLGGQVVQPVNLRREFRARHVGHAQTRRVLPRGDPAVLASAPLDGHAHANGGFRDELATSADRRAGDVGRDGGSDAAMRILRYTARQICRNGIFGVADARAASRTHLRHLARPVLAISTR